MVISDLVQSFNPFALQTNYGSNYSLAKLYILTQSEPLSVLDLETSVALLAIQMEDRPERSAQVEEDGLNALYSIVNRALRKNKPILKDELEDVAQNTVVNVLKRVSQFKHYEDHDPLNSLTGRSYYNTY